MCAILLFILLVCQNKLWLQMTVVPFLVACSCIIIDVVGMDMGEYCYYEGVSWFKNKSRNHWDRNSVGEILYNEKIKREMRWSDLMSYPTCRFCFPLRRVWLRTAAWAWRSSAATGPSLPHKPSPGPVVWCLLPYPPTHTPSHLQRDIQDRNSL